MSAKIKANECENQGKNMMQKHKRNPGGFSLIELLIVVAIILIISALAVPKLLRSKMLANEASAVSSLRTLNTSCVTYSTTWNGFPVQLSYMGPGTPYSFRAADLVDSVLVAGAKSGYNFSYISGPPSGGQVRTYTLNASPSVAGLTGTRYFFTDQTGIIRQDSNASATAASSPLN